MSRIDWFYARPGCESCRKTREELDRRGLVPVAERSTRQPLDEGEAKHLLRSVNEVWILRGGAVEPRRASSVRVAELRGPTGGIRAPMLRAGPRLLVGYREAILREWLNEV